MNPMLQMAVTAIVTALVQSQELFRPLLHTSATTGDSGRRYFQNIFLYPANYHITIGSAGFHRESFSKSGGILPAMVLTFTPER